MNVQRVLETPHRFSPFRALVSVFVAWKALLLCVAWASPGPGYDTSTNLLLPSTADTDSLILNVISYTSSKLVRWDALYFVRVAQRGRLFEQEWAWGLGWTKSIALIARGAINHRIFVIREAKSFMQRSRLPSHICYARLLQALPLLMPLTCCPYSAFTL